MYVSGPINEYLDVKRERERKKKKYFKISKNMMKIFIKNAKKKLLVYVINEIE